MYMLYIIKLSYIYHGLHYVEEVEHVTDRSLEASSV